MSRDHELATSFEQHRAFVLDQLHATGAAQNLHRAAVLNGAVTPELARDALCDLMSRHEILRTSLRSDSESLTQVVHDHAEPYLVLEEVPAVDDGLDGQLERARSLAAAFISQPFNLCSVPLWRMLLIRLSADQHVAVLSMHAAIGDKATLHLAFAEFVDWLVISTRDGEQKRHLAEPLQYREHVVHQEALDGALLEGEDDYWATRLGGELQPATFPATGSGEGGWGGDCGSHRTQVTDELEAGAERLAAQIGCSVDAVFAAGLAVLLYRYGARSKVTLGHTLKMPHGEPGVVALGPRENLGVLRLDLGADTTFDEAVRLTAEGLADADDRKDYPFQRLAGVLERSGGTGAIPPFRVLFSSELDLAPINAFSNSDELEIKDFELSPAGVLYDVQVSVRRQANRTVIDWTFDAERHELDQLARIADHYVQLLHAAFMDPSAPISGVDFMSTARDDTGRQEWNKVRTSYPDVCVHHLFEEQVARIPEATAVEFGDESLSYAELDRRANQLARRLRVGGASEGDMVGLCLERSAELVVAVVALLKAGCTIVPLDAAYPRERLAFMLDDANIGTVVTTGALIESDPVLSEVFSDVLQARLDADASVIEQTADGDLEAPVAADALAYCIYTSGSTGQPKGVLVDHRAMTNLITWHRDTWLAEKGTRTLLYSPISFDVSFHEILAGLCSGATLVQVDESTRRNPMALLEFARGQRIEKWYMPFVTLQQVALAAKTSSPPEDLRELIVGGEILRITPEIREFARKVGCVIHNHYGSTECIDVATYSLSGDPDNWPDVVPIGRANVHNMNLCILDDALQPVPMGVVGELCGEGDSLARGYHRRPELTAERFLPSPFETQGTRLYRTGDLGRYLKDGSIECVGRVDDLVKVRGIRVELGEIELALARHPAVAECVVVAREGAHGSTRLVAYVVPDQGEEVDRLPEAIRLDLAERLPDHMVPAAVVVLDVMPLTPSGKVDRRHLPEVPIRSLSEGPTGGADLEGTISGIWGDLLGLAEVDRRKTFFALGGDSLLLVHAHQRIAEALGRELSVETLFRYPTVESLAGYLGRTHRHPDRSLRAREPSPITDRGEGQEIAIVGMACRVPGARSISEFWANLRDGVESITELSPDEITKLQRDQTLDPRFVPMAATIPDVDQFDAEFFGYSPAEAAVIDPQQRLFLEAAWEAMEDGGVQGDGYRVGVYAGASLGTYLINNVLPTKLGSGPFLSHRHFEAATDLRIEQGNSRDHLPMRTSFKLGFTGPSVNVQSTCSTSLVAVHLAGNALLDGECDVALAGGVSIIIPQATGYLWRDGMMLAPDGHCRAFDADAEGTVFGNGLGVVVLKRLDTAVADGDRIYAVIRGSAVNNDGGGKHDYSGPSPEAQAEVIAQAQRRANVTSDEVSYVETHGTGTKLGDPIEIAGLSEAFRRTSAGGSTSCAIGSVKTNIGHLDEAAGVVGLIKTALSVHHGELPPSLNFSSPNPLADLHQSPFYVNTELREWTVPEDAERVAGISSFGMGGTNCHIVLAEAPAMSRAPSRIDRSLHILPITARSAEALRANMQAYIGRLAEEDGSAFADICYSAATGRRHFEKRVAIVAETATGASAELAEMAATSDLEEVISDTGGREPAIGFLFTGQGSQYAGMGRSLYETQSVFRDAMDQCDALLRPHLEESLVSLLYGPETGVSIDDTGTAQPALFAVGYALSRLWESWGIRPSVLVGHSLGECVAACVAGVYGLEDGLRLIAARGRLMQNLPRLGSMAQVNVGVEKLASYLADAERDVSIASINGPEATVISGRTETLESICRELRSDGIDAAPLKVSHAFHSPLMEPMLESFRAAAETVSYSAPTIDIVSNVTGEVVSPEEISSADYWVRHIVQPVQFDRAMQVAEAMDVQAFVEIGPKPTLSALARARSTSPGLLWLPSLRQRDSDIAIASLRELYLAGATVDWAVFDAPFHRSRVPLPTYAFQRTRHWLEPDTYVASEAAPPTVLSDHEDELKSERPQTLEVDWEPMNISVSGGPSPRHYVVIGGDALAAGLADDLRRRGHTCEGVASADAPELGKLLAGSGESCVVLVPDADGSDDVSERALRMAVDAGTVLERVAGSDSTKSFWLITRASELGAPTNAAEIGHIGAGALGRTIAAEHPEFSCITLAIPSEFGAPDLELAGDLLEEDALDCGEQLAIHKGRAFRARLRAVPPPEPTAGLPISTEGV